MNEERQIYPLKLSPIHDSRAWGKEEFLLADLGYKDTLISEGWLAGNTIGELMDTYIDRIVGEESYDFYGRQFPVCLRRLVVKGKSPLQVHPNDETAGERYDFLGKEKLWYILRAEKDSTIGLGFRRDTDASELVASCADCSVENIMNIVSVHPGQSFLIPSGTPHYASGDMEIIEIAESSPLDFCLCDWGYELSEEEFDPEFGLVDALDFINYGSFRSHSNFATCFDGNAELLVDIPQFRIRKLSQGTEFKSPSEFDSFVVYHCLKGSATINTQIQALDINFELPSSATMLIPAESSSHILKSSSSDTEILEICVHRKGKDSYLSE